MTFVSALLDVSVSLSKMLAKDWRRCNKLVQVKGCKDIESTPYVNTITKSPLVNCFFGQMPIKENLYRCGLFRSRF